MATALVATWGKSPCRVRAVTVRHSSPRRIQSADAAAVLDPAHGPLGPGGEEEEHQEPRRHSHARVERAAPGPRLLLLDRYPVLALVGPKLCRRLLQMLRRNQNHPVAGGVQQPGRQPLRFQHQGPLLGPPEVPRPAYDDFPCCRCHGWRFCPDARVLFNYRTRAAASTVRAAAQCQRQVIRAMPVTISAAPAATRTLMVSRSLRKSALNITIKSGLVLISGTTTDTSPWLSAM